VNDDQRRESDVDPRELEDSPFAAVLEGLLAEIEARRRLRETAK
jgi:hypothetical protein